MATRYEHNILRSTTKVTFDCGCWFEASDDAMVDAPRDLGVSFSELCAQVEQAHEHGDEPHRLECTIERRDPGREWALVISAYAPAAPDPKFDAMHARLDALMSGLAERICDGCGARVPRDKPITVTMGGRTTCSACQKVPHGDSL